MAHKIFSELLNFNEVHVHTELIKEQIIEVMDKLQAQADHFENTK